MEAILSTAFRILEFILLIGVLAFLHELGHFLMAKLGKIEVEEFGFGFPPRAIKLFTLKGTLFSLNFIPFGAFVRMKGEENPQADGWLTTANPWARLGTLLGGPVMNLITGVLIFSLIFMKTGAPNYSKVSIYQVGSDTPAETAGIQSGDILLSLNSTPIESIDQMRELVSQNLGHPVTISLERNGQIIDITVTPRENPPEGQGAVGIVMTNPYEPVSFPKALSIGAQETGFQIGQLLSLPGQLIKGTIAPEQARVVGPVGMYGIFSQAASLDAQTSSQENPTFPAVFVLRLAATISIALGFGNLLPLPALDGGRIIFILPELIFRKRVPAKWEATIHGVGFILLIALMIWITFQDIINPITIH
jgi:regulator of sigma E protease